MGYGDRSQYTVGWILSVRFTQCLIGGTWSQSDSDLPVEWTRVTELYHQGFVLRIVNNDMDTQVEIQCQSESSGTRNSTSTNITTPNLVQGDLSNSGIWVVWNLIMEQTSTPEMSPFQFPSVIPSEIRVYFL